MSCWARPFNLCTGDSNTYLSPVYHLSTYLRVFVLIVRPPSLGAQLSTEVIVPPVHLHSLFRETFQEHDS